MNNYITAAVIRQLREKKYLTQAKLAQLLGVSDKAISKWETGKGLPDITLMEPLAKTLGVSVIELMAGAQTENRNVSCNLLWSVFYVCPICGNVLHASGNAVVSCCGVVLPPLEAEDCDEHHAVTIHPVEDEHVVTIGHEMTKDHFISFLAWVTTDRLQLRGMGRLYICCNKHGLMRCRR